MKSLLRSRIDKHFATVSALVAAAAVGGAVREASATIVYSGVVNIPIPGTIAGVYLNLATGVNDVNPGNVPGWDINPYNGANNLYTAAPNYGTIDDGAGNVAVLAPGTIIDGSNAISVTANSGINFPTSGGGGLYGFRFQDENNGNQIEYGWAHIVRGTTATSAGVIVDYAYDNSGAGIAAGSTSSDPNAGACCLPTGSCTIVLAAACTSQGGTFHGAGSTCAAAACPARCCFSDGTCQFISATSCASGGGVSTAGSTCATACPQPGACCNNASCTMTSQAACTSSGGLFAGEGVTCANAGCASLYFVDDGTIEDAIGLTAGGAICYANQFTASAGANTVNDVRVAFGSPSTMDGLPITAYIWSDPNSDGNPTDALVLASVPGVVSGAFDVYPNNNPTFADFYLPSTTIPAGQNFFAGFVMQNQPAGTFPCGLDETSSLGRSWIGYSLTAGTFDPNAWTNVSTTDGIGFPGNWTIRAALANVTAPAACCMPNGTCQSLTLTACSAAGGSWNGPGSTCGNVTCPQPGACCLASGGCTQTLQGACVSQGGSFAGEGVTCANANCPQPGACCRNDGTCSILNSSACSAAGGGYQGDNTTCASAACGAFTVVNNVAGTFTEISGSGTALTVDFGSIDDGTATMFSSVTNALVTTANLYVGTNGMLSDTQAFNTFTNSALPQIAIPVGFCMYPNWDDQYVDAPGVLYHKATTEGGVPVEIVEWSQVRTFAGGTPVARGTYEVKIWGPGGPGLAQYIFQGDDSWDWNGNSSTVGVQWNTNKSFQYAFNNTNATPLPPFPIPDGSVFTVKPGGQACYANCDASTNIPFLNVADFTCFLQKFAAGAAYANCDASTTPPTLNVADFTCFLQKFAAGCSAP